jgi:hypothetical protein
VGAYPLLQLGDAVSIEKKPGVFRKIGGVSRARSHKENRDENVVQHMSDLARMVHEERE